MCFEIKDELYKPIFEGLTKVYKVAYVMHFCDEKAFLDRNPSYELSYQGPYHVVFEEDLKPLDGFTNRIGYRVGQTYELSAYLKPTKLFTYRDRSPYKRAYQGFYCLRSPEEVDIWSDWDGTRPNWSAVILECEVDPADLLHAGTLPASNVSAGIPVATYRKIKVLSAIPYTERLVDLE